MEAQAGSESTETSFVYQCTCVINICSSKGQEVGLDCVMFALHNTAVLTDTARLQLGYLPRRASFHFQCLAIQEHLHLPSIDNAAVGVDLLEVAMGVHVGGLRRWVQPEALASPQQDVQVVMEVVM